MMSDSSAPTVISSFNNEAANTDPLSDSAVQEAATKAANAIAEVASTLKPVELSTEMNPKEVKSPDVVTKIESGVNRPAYIPPHLMGRDLNNPAQDLIGTGRRVQKPRLGVKVPYRNLTSQIVSQDEIAQEILERSLRKYSYTDVPEGGDVFFAMKLTHRLANKINNSDAVEKIEKKNEEAKSVTEKPKAVECDKREANTSTSEKKEDSLFDSKAEELYAEISSTLSEDCIMPKIMKLTASTNSSPKKIVNGSVEPPPPPAEPEPEFDNDTLLAILEGTTDLNDPLITSTTSTPKSDIPPKRKRRVRPAIDPSVEKELALKQLMDFETKKHQARMMKLVRKPKPEEEGQNVSENKNPEAEAEKPKVKRNTYSLGSAPKRFPKKYQRIIKRQLRSSKMKAKTTSPDQPQTPQQKKLPEVPEVQIAIDKYFKTYANKRKHKPDGTSPEKPAEKKLKEDNAATPVATPVPSQPVAVNVKHQEVQVEAESDENRNEAYATDQEAKKDEVGPKPKASSKVMREINRLLGDEGAINMIYSIEQKRLPDNKRDANYLPSLRRKKKDLLLKTKLVKNAVLRLSMNSSQKSPGRVRRPSPEVTVKPGKSSASPPRKDSIESVESNTSEVPSPKVRKVAAEASRIIRRHSSSSAYSSDEEAPAADGVVKMKTGEAAVAAAVVPSSQVVEGETPRAGKSTTVAKSSRASPAVETKTSDTKAKSPKSSRRASKEGTASDSKAHADTMPLTNGPSTEVSEQISLKEITVRKYDNLVQIILISSSTKMKNSLNVQILRELTSVLRELQKDNSCRTVLVTSTGSSFCQGIDLQTLICADKTERNKIVGEYIKALNNFTKCLSQFRKLLIAGVHGSAVGLGVTMLPFFDMVFASDKATFYTPYVKLGQIPEAGATLTLPHLLGNAVTSELLFGCRMLTASEALQFGLVTRILWPDKFNEELLPLARGIASHSSQSMEATKLLLRRGMNAKLEEQLETEEKLLREHWCSDECQNRFKEFLQQEALLQNK